MLFRSNPTAELANHPLADALPPSATNGLRVWSDVMTWLPTTVQADQLQGPLGRISSAELRAIAAGMVEALALQCLDPWQLSSNHHGMTKIDRHQTVQAGRRRVLVKF